MGSCECKQHDPVHVSMVFTGVLSGTDHNQHVPFDRTLTQHPPNGVWDSNTHEFVCPKPGTYMFSFSLRPDLEHAASVHLMRGESDPVVSIFTDINNGNAGTSSQSTMLELKAGERIWLRLDDGAKMGIRSHPKSPSTTFNALLVHHDVKPVKDGM